MKGLAFASLVFGIIGILFCWFGVGIIAAVLALILGFTASFNRSARGVAMTGLVLALIGVIISVGIVYGLVHVMKHPQIVRRAGQEWLEDFMEKREFLEKYPGETVEKAAENANVPRTLILINPCSYMELVINELEEYPEKYPPKAGETSEPVLAE